MLGNFYHRTLASPVVATDIQSRGVEGILLRSLKKFNAREALDILGLLGQ